MTVNDWLVGASNKLEAAGIGTARLDSLVLLEDVTKKDRAHLLAHPEMALQIASLKKLDALVERRTKHEPLAFIRGKTEFYGREFIINQDVLEPRPESETMIDLLKTLLQHKTPHSKVQPWNIVDVGTGSGALAITAKLELPGSEVIATDIDPKCLVIAQKNAKKHEVNIKFLQGNLLQPISANSYQLTAIIANMPYVPDNYKINQAAAMEPQQAIFGGADGLDLYRQLFDQLNSGNIRTQFVLTESLPTQHLVLEDIAKKVGFKLQKSEDFIQVFRLEG